MKLSELKNVLRKETQRILKENDFGDDDKSFSFTGKTDADLLLTPLDASVEEVKNALNNLDNYGIYKTQLRNTKIGLEKALEDHFGPSQPNIKARIEKKSGKKFPIKTKQAVEDFINNFTKSTNILSYEIEGDNFRFPKYSNPEKGHLKKIITTVMDNAGINFILKLDSEI